MPLTPKVLTGGGGFHHWFHFPPGTGCGKPYPGIDRKAIGGYVIVPPSRIDCPEHEGRAYAWEVRPWEMPIADAPAWCYGTKPTPKESADAPSANPWIVRPAGDDLLSHPGSPEGERRRTLCQLVGVHLARGDSESSVCTMAEAWAKRCSPPLDDWRKHVDGLLVKEAAKGLKLTTPHAPQQIRVSVTEERSDTLTPGREQTNSASPSAPELVCSLPASGETEHRQGGELLIGA